VQELGSDAHRALIEHVVAHYRCDERVLAVAVFASVATGTWHPLSDVDMDIVTGDEVTIAPRAEVAALFGTRAAITLTGEDSADVVLDSLEEISIRWHPLASTSPFITASARVVAGPVSTAQLAAAGEANWAQPDPGRHLDAMVRDAIGAWKYLQRGRAWEAITAVQRVRPLACASSSGRYSNSTASAGTTTRTVAGCRAISAAQMAAPSTHDPVHAPTSPTMRASSCAHWSGAQSYR
jgi:hypothetical protein